MKLTKIYIVTLSALLLIPSIAFAAPSNFSDLVDLTVGYLNSLIPLIVTIELFFFVYGVAEFIRKSGKGDDLNNAKNKLMWGIIALFITFSYWGIVTFFTKDIFNNDPDFTSPTITPDKILNNFPRNDLAN